MVNQAQYVIALPISYTRTCRRWTLLNTESCGLGGPQALKFCLSNPQIWMAPVTPQSNDLALDPDWVN